MSDKNLNYIRSAPIRRRPAANLTAGETVLWIDTRDALRATVYIRQTQALGLADADDIVRFLIDTAYNINSDFVDSGNDLAVAVSAADPNVEQVFTLDAVTGLEVGDEVRIEQEILLIIAISGVTITVRRGQRGTAAVAHAAPTNVDKQDIRWVNIVRNSYVNPGDNNQQRQAVVTIGEQNHGVDIVDDVEGDLSADGVRELPLGARLRIRTQVAGATAPTYRYEAFADLFN